MDNTCDLICFSRESWTELTDREALVEAARDRRVFFVEEPLYERGPAFLSTWRSPEGVTIVRAGLPEGTTVEQTPERVRELVERLMDEEDIGYCTVQFGASGRPWFATDFAPLVVEADDQRVSWQPSAAMMA